MTALFVLVLAAAAATPSPAVLPPRFALPALQPDAALVFETTAGAPPKVRLRGTDTVITAEYGSTPPVGYAIDARHRLIWSRSSETLFLHRTGSRHLDPLGRARLEAVPGLGQLVRVDAGDWAVSFCDIDVKARRLRVLWTSPRRRFSGAGVLGHEGDAIHLLWMTSDASSRSVVVLRPGHAPREIPFVAPGWAPVPDAVRGSHVLVWEMPAGTGGMTRPPDCAPEAAEAPVALYDLQTGKLQRIGRAPLAWMPYIGGDIRCASPQSRVRWSDSTLLPDDLVLARPPGSAFALVDPRTHALQSP